MRNWNSLIIGAAVGIVLTANVASGAIISDFDSDLEGWTKINDVTVSHQTTGGNPGGFMQLDDHATGALFSVKAPAKFLGDLSAADGHDLSFDAIVLYQQRSTALSGFGKVTIIGSVGSASLDLGEIPDDSWTHYATPLDAATWGETTSAWSAMLSDVVEIRVELEAINGDETIGFDNFTIVPEPAGVMMLFIGGLTAIGRRRS